MGLEGICALYSFKINAPRFEPLRNDAGMRPPGIDPYNEYRRPSLLKPYFETPLQPLNVVPLSDGTQFHSHEGGYGHFKNGNAEIGRPFNAYETAVAEETARILGLPIKKRVSRPKNEW